MYSYLLGVFDNFELLRSIGLQILSLPIPVVFSALLAHKPIRIQLISQFNKGEPIFLFLLDLEQLLELDLVVLPLSSKLLFGISYHFLNQTISRIFLLQEISVAMECVHVPLIQDLHEEKIMKNYQALGHVPMELL